MSQDFKDHFSTQSTDYALFRPQYPTELFSYLASLTSQHESAWDCATGSGQAALGLADYYEQVMATDASAQQIAKAKLHEKINYLVAPAEGSPFSNASQDLVTVAQALHWFNLKPFYQEVTRVLKPGGVIAVWTYNLLRITPQVDALIDQLYQQILSGYWPEERRLVETGYTDILFPFEELTAPEFSITAHWSLEQLLGYLGTWSAVQKYRKNMHKDPIDQIAGAMTEVWPDAAESVQVSWPLMLRVGRATF